MKKLFVKGSDAFGKDADLAITGKNVLMNYQLATTVNQNREGQRRP